MIWCFIHCQKTAGTSISRSLRPLPGKFTQKGTHWPATLTREQMGVEAWDLAFKFAFIRNPWDRILSMYCFSLGPAGPDGVDPVAAPAGFKQWLVNMRYVPEGTAGAIEPKMGGQPIMTLWEMLTERDQILVDFVGRFETLEADFEEVSRRISGVAGRRLQNVNPSVSRQGVKDYRGFYDDESAAWIQERCRQEIDFWGYTFDPEG